MRNEIMQALKVSCEPWCVNDFDTFGVFVGKMSNLRESCLMELGIGIFHGLHFPLLPVLFSF